MTRYTRELKKSEAELRLPTTIDSVTDYIRLMQRYKRYLKLFSRRANATAKRLLRHDYQQHGMDKLRYKLYLSERADEVIFENTTAVTFYHNEKSDTSMDELMNLYNHPSFEAIKSSFKTPILISKQAREQLQVMVCSSRFERSVDEIIMLLSKHRAVRLSRLLPCL